MLHVWNTPNLSLRHVIVRGVRWWDGLCASSSEPYGPCFCVFIDDNVGVTENRKIYEVIESASERSAVDSATDTDCDNGGRTAEPVIYVVAIVVLGTVGNF